jgi:hypothetical protein
MTEDEEDLAVMQLANKLMTLVEQERVPLDVAILAFLECMSGSIAATIGKGSAAEIGREIGIKLTEMVRQDRRKIAEIKKSLEAAR